MSPILPAPNEEEWEILNVEDASELIVLFSEYTVEFGFAFSAIALIASAVFIRLSGFPLSDALTGEWWEVFGAIGIFCIVLVLHELAHIAFANTDRVKLTVCREYGALAVQIGGEVSKSRFVWILLAPTVIITGICFPLSVYYWNPYLMAAALMNIGLAGADWANAIKMLLLLEGDRLYFDGVTAYAQVQNSRGGN